MASGFALLGGAVGAGQGLKELLAQRIAERERQAQARQQALENQLKERQFGEQVRGRQATEAATAEDRAFRHQLSYDQLRQALQLGQESQAGQTQRAQNALAGQNQRSQESIAAQNERAAEQRALQRVIAEGNQGLRRDAAEEKRAAAATDVANRRRAIVGNAQETASVIDQLLTPEGNLQPGVSGITGHARVPAALVGVPGIRELGGFLSGGDIANKQAALDRLKSRALVDLIAEMKSQTRTGATGFGQLSEKEGVVLQNAAVQLQQAQTEDQVRNVLKDLRTKINKIMQEPTAGPTTGPGAGVQIERWGRDAAGRPIRIQ